MTEPVSDDELTAHHCLEAVDKVPGDPETTTFKRRARLQQALWREGKGLEIGTQPMRPKVGQPSRPLGSRIALDQARESWANFLGEGVRRAVCHRIAGKERLQTLDEDRLYCDLLSSMPMCFNLFGELYCDLEAADRAVHRWWPDVPGKVSGVRFEWSPGRRLPGEYLENRSAFDVAFELALDDGTKGVVGVETKYHEDCRKPTQHPEKKCTVGDRCGRYEHVARKSGVFKPNVFSAIPGTELEQIWLDHLLALSMLQHPSRRWTWAKFVLVYPEANPSYARAVTCYAKRLDDSATFEVSTIESLLDAGVLPGEITAVFKERYLW